MTNKKDLDNFLKRTKNGEKHHVMVLRDTRRESLCGRINKPCQKRFTSWEDIEDQEKWCKDCKRILENNKDKYLGEYNKNQENSQKP